MFADKYLPLTIDDFKFHKNIIQRLKNMSRDESIPHMLFCGPSGSGKKTIIRFLLEMLYDSNVHKLKDSIYTVIGSNGKPTEVTIKQSDYHIVIEPNNNNFDRYLIQDIVKEYAKKMQLGVFNTKKVFKTVIINNVDNLSYYAQTSLRRTMEKFSSTCRFIMWCSCSTRVIEPLISRCLFFTVPSPTDKELFAYIAEIAAREQILLTLKDYNNILDTAQGNIKEALWILTLYKLNIPKKHVYTKTVSLLTRIIISHNINQIDTFSKNKHLKNLDGNTRIFVRDLLYNMMITNINGTRIFNDLLNQLCDNPDLPDECKYHIIDIISQFEHNLICGRRNIIHMEAAIIEIMKYLKNYVEKHPDYKPIFNSYTTEYYDDQKKIKKIYKKQPSIKN